MNGKNINSDDKKIKKSDFYKKKNKKIFNMDDIDYIIGYNDNDVIRPKLSRMTGYINEFIENKNTIIMSIRVNDERLFKKYNKI